MNLLLFVGRKGELHAIAEQPPAERRPEHLPETSLQRLKEKVREGYTRLAERLSPQELVCVNLRHANRLTVLHSSLESSAVVAKSFRQMIKMSYSKHARWLWIDAMLAFLGTFCMFLPGPNVFFFYPAFRSLGHYLARNGARNVLNLQDVSFRTEPSIDRIQQGLSDVGALNETVQELEVQYRIRNLKPLVNHLASK